MPDYIGQLLQFRVHGAWAPFGLRPVDIPLRPPGEPPSEIVLEISQRPTIRVPALPVYVHAATGFKHQLTPEPAPNAATEDALHTWLTTGVRIAVEIPPDLRQAFGGRDDSAVSRTLGLLDASQSDRLMADAYLVAGLARARLPHALLDQRASCQCVWLDGVQFCGMETELVTSPPTAIEAPWLDQIRADVARLGTMAPARLRQLREAASWLLAARMRPAGSWERFAAMYRVVESLARIDPAPDPALAETISWMRTACGENPSAIALLNRLSSRLGAPTMKTRFRGLADEYSPETADADTELFGQLTWIRGTVIHAAGARVPADPTIGKPTDRMTELAERYFALVSGTRN